MKLHRHLVAMLALVAVLWGCGKRQQAPATANELGVDIRNAVESIGYVTNAQSLKFLLEFADAGSERDANKALDKYCELIRSQIAVLSQLDAEARRIEQSGSQRPAGIRVMRDYIQCLERLARDAEHLYEVKIPAGMKAEVGHFLLSRRWPAKSSASYSGVPLSEQKPILPMLRALSNRLYFATIATSEGGAMNVPKIGSEAWQRLFNIESADMPRAQKIEELVAELAVHPVLTPSSSETAANLLVRLGGEAVDSLLTAFTSTNKNQRLWANVLLSQFAPFLSAEQRREIVAADLVMLDSEDPAEWVAGARSLAFLREVDALGRICRLALDKVGHWQTPDVIDSLRRMNHPGAVPTLMQIMESSDIAAGKKASIALSAITREAYPRALRETPTETPLQYHRKLQARWRRWYDRNRQKYSQYEHLADPAADDSTEGQPQ